MGNEIRKCRLTRYPDRAIYLTKLGHKAGIITLRDHLALIGYKKYFHHTSNSSLGLKIFRNTKLPQQITQKVL